MLPRIGELRAADQRWRRQLGFQQPQWVMGDRSVRCYASAYTRTAGSSAASKNIKSRPPRVEPSDGRPSYSGSSRQDRRTISAREHRRPPNPTPARQRAHAQVPPGYTKTGIPNPVPRS